MGRPRPPLHLAPLLTVLVASLALAGCGGAMKGAKSTLGSIVAAGGGPDEVAPATPEPPRIRCPQVRVRPGGEVIRREDASGTPEGLRWQASVAKIARECTTTGTGVSARVGIAGRVVRGAAGRAETVSLPVRVTVREGNETTYDKVQSVSVSLGSASVEWAVVDEAVVIANTLGAVIYVGFDT